MRFKSILMSICLVFLLVGTSIADHDSGGLTTGQTSTGLLSTNLPSLFAVWNLSLDFATNSCVGTATLQRSFNGSTWYDVEAFTTDTQKQFVDSEKKIRYRVKYVGTNTLVYRLSY